MNVLPTDGMATKTNQKTASVLVEPFTWRAHPARERPWAARAAVGVIAAAGAATGFLAGAWWWGVVAAAVLVLSLNRFFFPSSFTIEPEGVVAKYWFNSAKFRWSDVRRFAFDRNGAFLSTRSQSSRMDAFRGIHLLFGSEREEIISRIRERLDAKEEAS